MMTFEESVWLAIFTELLGRCTPRLAAASASDQLPEVLEHARELKALLQRDGMPLVPSQPPKENQET